MSVEEAWKWTIEHLPNEELANIMQHSNLQIPGFRTETIIHQMDKQRNRVITRLLTGKKLDVIIRVKRNHVNSCEKCQQYREWTIEEMIERGEQKNITYKILYSLLTSSNVNHQEKANELIKRLKVKEESPSKFLLEMEENHDELKEKNHEIDQSSKLYMLEREIKKFKKISAKYEQLQKEIKKIHAEFNEERKQWKEEKKRLKNEIMELNRMLDKEKEQQVQARQRIEKYRKENAELYQKIQEKEAELSQLQAFQSKKKILLFGNPGPLHLKEDQPLNIQIMEQQELQELSMHMNFSTFQDFHEYWLLTYKIQTKLQRKIKEMIDSHKLREFKDLQELRKYVDGGIYEH